MERRSHNKYRGTADTLYDWLERYSGSTKRDVNFCDIAFLFSGIDVVENSAAASQSIGSGGLRFFDEIKASYKALGKPKADAETLSFRKKLRDELIKIYGSTIPIKGIGKIRFAAYAVRQAIGQHPADYGEEKEVKDAVTNALNSLAPNDRNQIGGSELDYFRPANGWFGESG